MLRLSIPAAALAAAAAYLLGSVPFALLLGRLKGVDIRTLGSGNIGATNLSRALGRRWGIAAFVLDFLKGLLPVLAAGWIARPGAPEGILADHARMACGLAAIMGHIFPLWLRFRGGKGVATSFGALAGLAWPAALTAGALWLALYGITRTVSIASLAAALVFPVAVIFLFRSHPAEVSVPMGALSVLVAGLILVRHRSNIRRLLTREENRF
jgi:acyl phosphate:glycerol-3-phosphate acyltransferase